ncbi:MAG: helix-turn-helix transcriptional regulator [Sphingobacteriaceae bacterium]
MGIGSILKRLRKSCKYSQKYVAECLNISRNAYMAWENGDTRVNMNKLLLICDLYQVSLQKLLVQGDTLVINKKTKKQKAKKVKKTKPKLLEYLS